MKKGLLYITLLLLVVGCRLDRTKDQEPLGSMSLPVTISLPMENTYAQRLIRRSIGDPGKDERFARPKHVYFFVLKYDGENWSVWHKEHREPADEDWTPKRYSGSLSTSGDSIYEYNRPINLLLSNEKFEGQVFVIASAKELEFNTPFASITTADQVRNLQFNVAEPNTNANLQDIYSSPYNYEVNGSYYGSFSSIYQKVPHVNLMLYHVAAKVDIKWSVDEEKRINKTDPSQAIRLTYMKAMRIALNRWRMYWRINSLQAMLLVSLRRWMKAFGGKAGRISIPSHIPLRTTPVISRSRWRCPPTEVPLFIVLR